MSYKLKVRRRAEDQIKAAYEYYENAQIGLGDRFLHNLDQQLQYIRHYPKHFPRLIGDIRQALVYRFPFQIVYEQIEDTVVVYSVFHTSQNPDRKLENG